MDEPERGAVAAEPLDAAFDFNAPLASLRAAGAQRFDPVRWHFIEALATRATAHQGGVRRVLDAKLAQALAAFKERLDQARADAEDAVAGNATQYPAAAGELRRLFDAGDFNELRRFIATLSRGDEGATLGALVRRLEQHAAETGDAHVAGGVGSAGSAGSRSELKTIRNFRNVWSKLSADKRVAQALEQAPADAGPINSHMLVLRSLAAMRDISPDYLNRFMSYADALLCLDQCETDSKRGTVRT
ncbi:MAG: DUF2894 domain-containing protein [Burkholderiaceae bacterium]|nr:DUF2894 domain-containing protein [Burkholderiaceae bacterium]